MKQPKGKIGSRRRLIFENKGTDHQVYSRQYEPHHDKKPVFWFHKLGCRSTEDGYRSEISNLGSRGIVLYNICGKNKGTYQLYGLCFRIYPKGMYTKALCTCITYLT